MPAAQLATTTTATRGSRRVAKLQLADAPQPILRPRRWAVYTSNQRRIDREPAYVVAVSELLTTRAGSGLGRLFALNVRMRIRQTRAMAGTDMMRRYLIVSDHALDDQQLAVTVQPSLAAGPCQFYLLVLATPAGTKTRVLWGALGGCSASAPNPGPAEELGWDRAREQLAHNLVRLRKLGAEDGETGEPPPLRAIREVLARRPCDEIILATAPHRMTRLLAMDLQHRVHRSFGLPVTVLGIARTES